MKDLFVDVDGVMTKVNMKEVTFMSKPDFKGVEKFVFDENGKIIGLQPEERSRLMGLIDKHYAWCKCYPDTTEYGVGKIIDTWFTNMVWFLNLMVKHPNWNGDYAIEFTKQPIQRTIDRVVFKKFIDRMYGWSEYLKVPYVIGEQKYSEITAELGQLEDLLYHAHRLLDAFPIVEEYISANEERQVELSKAQNKYIELKDNGTIVRWDGEMYEREEVRKINRIKDCFYYLESHRTQFISKETEEYINEQIPNFKAKEGQKTSRVVNKLCKMAGLDKMTWRFLDDHGVCIRNLLSDDTDFNTFDYEKNAYNVLFARFADSINPFNVDKHLFISIHPVEAYLTQSWGTTWASCHSTDKNNVHGWEKDETYQGMYSSGTLSYMLDKTSITMYILGENAEKKAEENGEPSPRKEMRQMFHIGKEKFIQGRLYPLDQTDKDRESAPEDYVQYREIMQNVLSLIMDIPNLWTNERGSYACSNWTRSLGTHYKDYEHYNNVNISFLKGYTNTESIEIGHRPICPKCGMMHSENGDCFCDSCRNERDEEEYSTWCEYHQRYEDIPEDEMYYIRDYGNVCEDAYESGDFDRCDRCGEYFDRQDTDYVRSDADDHVWCSEYCAERDGYCYYENTNDWVNEDELHYSEIDNEDIWEYDDDAVWAIYNEDGDDTIARRDSCIEYCGDWYDEHIMVETESGDYIPEWKAVDVHIDGDGTTEIYDIDEVTEEEDFLKIDGEWYLTEDLVLTVHGNLLPVWETVEIGMDIYPKDEAVFYNGEWYNPLYFIDVDGTQTPIDMSEMYEVDERIA